MYSGGIGSYALLCMVMAHLQLHNTTCKSTWAGSHGASDASEGCLGTLLIDFFELFGRRLTPTKSESRAVGRVLAFSRSAKRECSKTIDRFFGPSKILRTRRTISAGIRTCRQVKSAFEHAFTVITAPVDSRHGFLLRRIVKMDPTWCKGRKPPKNPGAIRGVALDFPQYIDLGRKRAAREQKQTAEKEARGKKRARVDETPEEESVSEEDITVSESEEEETPKTKKKTKRANGAPRQTAHTRLLRERSSKQETKDGVFPMTKSRGVRSENACAFSKKCLAM